MRGILHGTIGRKEGGGDEEPDLTDFLPGPLPSLPVARVRQVHGCRVSVVSANDPVPEGEEADGIVTDRPGVALRIRVADCMPLFLVDPDGGVLALVHAGWRGLAAGVVGAAVDRFRGAGGRPDRSLAAIGPSIGPCCYEVGDEVLRAFGKGARVAPGPGPRPHLDLYTVAIDLLVAHGFTEALLGKRPPCTACGGEKWHSHRAAKGAPGRNIAFLARLPLSSR